MLDVADEAERRGADFAQMIHLAGHDVEPPAGIDVDLGLAAGEQQLLRCASARRSWPTPARVRAGAPPAAAPSRRTRAGSWCARTSARPARADRRRRSTARPARRRCARARCRSSPSRTAARRRRARWADCRRTRTRPAPRRRSPAARRWRACTTRGPPRARSVLRRSRIVRRRAGAGWRRPGRSGWRATRPGRLRPRARATGIVRAARPSVHAAGAARGGRCDPTTPPRSPTCPVRSASRASRPDIAAINFGNRSGPEPARRHRRGGVPARRPPFQEQDLLLDAGGLQQPRIDRHAQRRIEGAGFEGAHADRRFRRRDRHQGGAVVGDLDAPRVVGAEAEPQKSERVLAS